jgi:hypothetical protein
MNETWQEGKPVRLRFTLFWHVPVILSTHNRQNLLEFYQILTVTNPFQRGHCLEIPGYPFRDGL